MGGSKEKREASRPRRVQANPVQYPLGGGVSSRVRQQTGPADCGSRRVHQQRCVSGLGSKAETTSQEARLPLVSVVAARTSPPRRGAACPEAAEKKKDRGPMASPGVLLPGPSSEWGWQLDFRGGWWLSCPLVVPWRPGGLASRLASKILFSRQAVRWIKQGQPAKERAK